MPTTYFELWAEASREVPQATRQQIQRDVPRTLSGLPEDTKLRLEQQSEAVRRALERILVASEWRHANAARVDIGATYTQGMNYIAAMCVADLWDEESGDGEELSFWLYDLFLAEVLGTRFFAEWPPLLGYHACAACLQSFAAHACPRLLAALKDEFNDVVAMLGCRYFVPCFVGLIPGEPLVALWSELFAAVEREDVAPYRSLFCWYLALLQHLEPDVVAAIAALQEDEPRAPTAFQQFLELARQLPAGWRPASHCSSLCVLGPELVSMRQRAEAQLMAQAEDQKLLATRRIPADQITALHREFMMLPRDGTGIDRESMHSIWRRAVGAEVSSTGVDCLFQMLDRDGSGTLDFFELMTGFFVLSSGARDQKLRLLFDLYDTDGSGSLGSDELLCLAKALVKMSSCGGGGGGQSSQRDSSAASSGGRRGAGSGAAWASADERTAATQFRRRLLLLDTDCDNYISWEEFRAGIDVDPTIAQVLARAGVTEKVTAREVPAHLVPRGQLFLAIFRECCSPCCGAPGWERLPGR